MSANYIAYLEQTGEGCDYTIGCGVKLILVSGSTYDEAIAELRQIVLEDYNHSECRLRRVTLYEVSDTAGQPVNEWYAEYEADQKRAALEQASAAEREQYERLRKKYG